MSKKARMELDRQGRVEWAYSPVSKVFESKKAYNRRNRDWLKEEDRGFLCSPNYHGILHFGVIIHLLGGSKNNVCLRIVS